MEQNVKLETPEELAKRLKLPFETNIHLLSRALTHRSYINEHSEALEDNERLEFLGDAVLDFTVGAWLYNHYPEMPEGDLTRMRSALVHTEQLAEFAAQIDLGNAMRLGHGEDQAGGRNRAALLCDTFEAVVGALYLAKGIDGVMDFIMPFINVASDDILVNHKNEDPKSKLQEWSQAQGLATPTYVTQNMVGPDHDRIFDVVVLINGVVYGSGKGRSKQAAAKNAAQAALQQLEDDHKL
jgi:ribonuclease-3